MGCSVTRRIRQVKQPWGGYTYKVFAGDGDFLTKDTLWDFKVLRGRIDKNHTLQLLMYWRMGLHTDQSEFRDIKYLGIYNPRKNIVSRLPTFAIPKDVIGEVEHDVIGY